MVTVEDSGGNPVPTSTDTITLLIASPPGSGATLTCDANPMPATGGVAAFTGCQIIGYPGSYTLSRHRPLGRALRRSHPSPITP